MEKYDDIINLQHHVSTRHPRMSLEQRSAQFAPFAALTGYEGQVKESARLTDKKIEIDEELKTILDMKIQILQNRIKESPEIEITYFVSDRKKDGGEYINKKIIIKKIDKYNQEIITNDNFKIPINEIISIDSDIFICI